MPACPKLVSGEISSSPSCSAVVSQSPTPCRALCFYQPWEFALWKQSRGTEEMFVWLLSIVCGCVNGFSRFWIENPQCIGLYLPLLGITGQLRKLQRVPSCAWAPVYLIRFTAKILFLLSTGPRLLQEAELWVMGVSNLQSPELGNCSGTPDWFQMCLFVPGLGVLFWGACCWFCSSGIVPT